MLPFGQTKHFALTCLLAVAVTGTSVTTALASTVTFTDEAAFLAAATPNVFEGFESFPHVPICSTGGPTPASSVSAAFFTVTSTPTTSGGTSFLCLGTAGDPYPTEGINALIAGSNSGSSWDLSFALAAPTLAVGFDLTDVAEWGNAYLLTEAGELLLVAACCSTNDLFFGFVSSSPFTSFTLRNAALGDGWGVDRMQFQTAPVPEPATLLLVGLGLGATALRRRRLR